MKQWIGYKKTQKYVGAYDYLDEWEDLGAADVSTIETREEGCDWGGIPFESDDYCDAGGYRMLVRMEKEFPYEDVKRAFYHTFGKRGCGHEYDCCGCVSTYVTSVETLNEKDFIVEVNGSRNY